MYQNDSFVLGNQRYVEEEDLFRVNHDKTLWRPNLPEVFPFFPNHYTPFTRGYQLLENNLNIALDNAMTGSKWHNLHLGGNQGDKATAFNNRQGFEMVGDPRVDYVNGKNLGAPNPKQEALVCGGAILKMKSVDSQYLYPAYIDGNRPAPTLEWLLARPYLFFDALSVDGSPNGIVLRKFPQGDGKRVRILLLASKPIKIALSQVTKLKRNQPEPSPYSYP
jgi:hypothetical protein